MLPRRHRPSGRTRRGKPALLVRAIQGVLACTGSAGVWTFFGGNDPHFLAGLPGEFGDEQVAFWRATYACGEEESVLETGAGECVAFKGCAEDLRYCLYGPESGHQIPLLLPGRPGLVRNY